MSKRSYLAHLMHRLRDAVKSPHAAYDYLSPTPVRANVGFIGHERCGYSGHRVFEIVNERGGERNLAEGMTLQACIRFVEGMLTGVEGRVKRYGTIS